MRFNWVVIFVQDVEASVRFYRDLLGFAAVKEGPGSTRLQSPDGGPWLSIHSLTDQQQPPWNDGIMLHFEVDDLDALYARLDAAEVQVQQPPRLMPWDWRHAYVLDPDGHVISFYSTVDAKTPVGSAS